MAEVEAKAMELEVPKTDVNDVITPVLSLESLEEIQDPAVEKIDQKDAEEFRMKQFSEEEMKQINDFSEKIDLHDSNLIITYGAGAQKRLADFSETALEHVRNKDIDEIGETVSQLVADLKVDPTENKGIKSSRVGYSVLRGRASQGSRPSNPLSTPEVEHAIPQPRATTLFHPKYRRQQL